MELTFLGTGGGRFTMIEQLRKTGGMVLEDGDFSCLIDPAPGALVRAREEDVALEELDALIVSHAHLDHDGDMKAVIEAMTEGGDRDRGTLLCTASVLDGADIPDRYTEGEGTYGDSIAPSLDPYHRDLVGEVVRLEDGTERELGPWTMRCIETEHSDPRTVAFTLEREEFSAGFVTDTELFPELETFFSGCDTLVVNLMRPHDRAWKGHLNTEDAAELLNAVDPDIGVMQHFGAALIYESVADEMEWLRERTDVDVVMAEDGMTIDLEQPRQGINRFL